MIDQTTNGYHDFNADDLEPANCSVCGRGPAHYKHVPQPTTMEELKRLEDEIVLKCNENVGQLTHIIAHLKAFIKQVEAEAEKRGFQAGFDRGVEELPPSLRRPL